MTSRFDEFDNEELMTLWTAIYDRWKEAEDNMNDEVAQRCTDFMGEIYKAENWMKK